ncbi:cupin domain-containing protein [Mesorhizobium silamurunense]|uniref:cupin domain-containing protein n=1 Tax=Mesorhizobium silamurunense TaxID=499528 RepID=UPI00177C14B0|nr:cupin domain-containing protein [Mesorhizobium silamurunense]
MDSAIKRPSDTKIFMEGPEVCRLYYKTEKLTFGSSQLNPGQTGAVDHGHPNSHEVFFCARGTVLLRVSETYYEMHEGDAVLVPPSEPHQLTNIGLDVALVTWSLAPSE